MSIPLNKIILKTTKATDLFDAGTIQSLWSGYGSIDRYGLIGSSRSSVVVKHVRLPDQSQHPRGWDSDRSHQRKVRSYQVESEWYRQWSARCGESARVPECLALEQHEGEWLMVLEDLDSSGYSQRKDQVTLDEMRVCLSWLAHFHAQFMGETPAGLWPVGCYWHLETRPDELASMEEGALKEAAEALDKLLTTAPFQTVVHGDAKLANFCFSAEGDLVAAVDFQYVGGGCGMKDVAYFIGSCLNESECERLEDVLLTHYFSALNVALSEHQPEINPDEVEAAWRPLYPVAWTDFYRFLKGWSPDHWKIHRYSERLAKEVVAALAF
ncbi:MAG: phosphotransferase [Gammaproteobacteria bacterium]|nr:phosphotransferase [Gammaproteobacteria bacterium]